MTELPAPPSRSGPALTAEWVTALIRGGLAFVIMALLGQLTSFALSVAEGGRLAGATVAKLGWFYFGWFHHVGVTAEVSNLSLGQLGTPIAGAPVPTGALTGHVGVALMLVTLLAGWLLFGAGRAVATRAGGGAVARALHGMKVAPAYAVPSFLISSFVTVRLTLPANSFASGTLEVRSSPVEALLFPLLIAAAAGAAGGFSSAKAELASMEPWGRRLAGVLSGGLRMFLLGLVLSFAGLLLLAVAEPDSTKAYFDAVTSGDAAETAVLIGHHVLLLPNQSMWVLVPAMGGCDGVYGSRVSSPFLCYWKYPQSVDVQAAVVSGPQARYSTAPPLYFLFLLVPLLSALAAGRWAARRGARVSSEAGPLGAAAGVVFAVLVVVGSLLASLTVGGSASIQGFASGVSVRAGPNVVTGGVLALAWGVLGGFAGGYLAGRKLPAAAAPVGFEPELPPPPPTAPAAD